ncbi:two component transcriptional regulator, winged helix family [Methylobacterium sp. 4-46]|uniref:response regulator transcription factor n=1 Tax=unclassified Methylobacterium TaxID=2615210 RepID=UPI000152DD96|nr:MULTISPECIES: response regulator transcription factor [Methylobacterium]ACA14645.1 two component transcriptional regulator, winged helix family [Methylobacterium sp. 4-46]WFT80398.1 response regulator transcription factor [Methylobacterium nodulans]
MRILLVEDTRDLGEAIATRLRALGHAVDWERDGADGDAALQVQAYDLVILDVNLPGLDGFSVLRRLRARRGRSPVLVLTARSEVDDRVGALDLGADDYLVKPFDFRELEARVRALLRRHSGHADNAIAVGNLVLDRAARSARVAGQPLDLTRREWTLMEILAARPGRIFGKAELLERVTSFEEDASENAVEQIVARLRRKLAQAGAEPEIRTLRGLGYQVVWPQT